MEFQHDIEIASRSGAVGEHITTVHGVPIFELDTSFSENEKMILNFGNPVFTPDELREIADEVEDFYSEPTFEERVRNVADDFGLDFKEANTYEDGYRDDAQLEWASHSSVDRTELFDVLDEFCWQVNFGSEHVWVEADE